MTNKTNTTNEKNSIKLVREITSRGGLKATFQVDAENNLIIRLPLSGPGYKKEKEDGKESKAEFLLEMSGFNPVRTIFGEVGKTLPDVRLSFSAYRVPSREPKETKTEKAKAWS